MGWCIVLVLALAGCDVVFRLDDLQAPVVTDAGPDAPIVAIDAPEACPTTYAPVPNAPATSKYRFAFSTVPWELAEIDCEHDSVTDITHLVVFDDLSELEALRAVSSGPTFAGYARNTGSDSQQFYALTGEAASHTEPPWNANQPDNGGASGNEETIVWFSYTDYMIDGPYFMEAYYACECDHQRVTLTFTLH